MASFNKSEEGSDISSVSNHSYIPQRIDTDKVTEEARQAAASISPNPCSELTLPQVLNPTGLLAQRCNTWNKLVRVLINYFREVVTVLDDTVRLQDRAARAIDIPFFDSANVKAPSPVPTPGNFRRDYNSSFKDNEDKMFLDYGNESIADVPITLLNLHRDTARIAANGANLVRNELLPSLDTLRKDLLRHSGDFQNLSPRFKNADVVPREQQASTSLAQNYAAAIDSCLAGKTPHADPFVLKVQLQEQLHRQAAAENSLLDAYRHAETLSQEVETATAMKIQDILKEFANVLGGIGDVYVQTAASIVEGFGSKHPLFELNSFFARENKYFFNAEVPERVAGAAVYRHQYTNLARAVRQGELERRTKYLKSFTRSEYVLTPQSLIEYRNGQPVLTIDLVGASLDTDHKHAAGDRFVLQARQTDTGKVQSWIFRSDNADGWIEDIKKVLAHKTPKERAEALFGSLESAPAVSPATAGLATAAASGVALSTTAVKSMKVSDDNGTRASTPRRPINYKRDDNAGPSSLTASAGAAAGGAHNAGLDVEEKPRRPSAYRKEPNALDDRPLVGAAVGDHEASAIHTTDDEDDTDGSVFSYDLTHKATTYAGEDYRPETLSVAAERRMTQTSHRLEEGDGIGVARTADEANEPPETVLRRRKSSISATSRKGSRRATASYGDEIKPLTAQLTSDQPEGLFFSEGLPATTSGKE